MNTFFATFSPGFEKVIVTRLQADIADIKISTSQESSVVFSTSESYRKVTKLKYFSNIYFLLSSIDIPAGISDYDIVRKLNDKANYREMQQQKDLPEIKTYRIMVQKGNQLIGVNKKVTDSLKGKIYKQTRLEHSPLKADIEFWYLIRNEGTAYVVAKIISQIPDRKTEKGELKLHVAHVLNLLSDPSRNDIFMDPFSGYASIPADRAENFQYTHIYASDIDKKQIGYTEKRLKKYKNITTAKADATNLKHIGDNSIDKIVTDPPWGMYNQRENIQDLYTGTLKECIRVAKPGAIIVLLTAKREEFELALKKFPQLTLVHAFSTLVNGKKAGVYKVSVSK